MISANTSVRPLRIVHSESSCGWGGQEIRILGESEGLIRRGHDVRLLCPAQAPIFEAARRRNIPAEPLPIERRTVAALAAVRRWMKTNRFDVINTHSSTDSWLFAVAAKILGPRAPIVRTRHISVTPARDPLTRWLYTRGADMIVTTGERLRQNLISHNRVPQDRLISIPTGIDADRFVPADPLEARRRLGLPLEKTIVGVVATLRHGKGHDCLIDAVHQLARSDLHLLVVGHGKMRPAIDAQIERLGMTDRVTLPGNQEDVVPWLQAMDVFTLPSYANEGVPQCIMQAMSCGLPVVATPAGSIEEAVTDGETGLIVPKHDAGALAAALKTLLDDEALRRRFAAEGRRVAVERFGVDRMLDRMEDVFRRFVVER
jgi:glycosyltransferase involved in cell wall biosynthesis